MSLSNNFPAIKPSLLLDFANTGSLDPRVTFSRASTATYYDGVTTAKAEENLLTYSQEFDAGWLNSGTVDSADTTQAPDGTMTADTVTANASTASHLDYQVIVASPGNTRVYSVYAKKSTHDYIQLSFNNYITHYVNFDINTGVVGTVAGSGSSATITSVGNGWYRCVYVYPSATETQVRVALVPSNTAARVESWTATGTEAVYLWGAQLEQRSAVSSYTVTTTQPITTYIPVLQTAAANVARFDHNPTTGEALGLLIEEQRTNVLTFSEKFNITNKLTVTGGSGTFIDGETVTATGGGTGQYDGAQSTAATFYISNASGTFSGTLTGSTSSATRTISTSEFVWFRSKTSITANSVVAPDGTLTGDTLVMDAVSNDDFYIYQVYSGWTSGVTYTQTWYVKSAGITWVQVTGSTGTGATSFRNINIVTGALGNGNYAADSVTATSVGNGWYRIRVTETATSTTASGRFLLALLTSDVSLRLTNVNGDGYSGIFIWGAQLEAGAFPTSYIATTSAQVTRSADAASMTGTNFSSWYNAGQGTLFAEFVNTPSAFIAFAINDNSANNRIQIGNNPTGTASQALIWNSGVSQMDANNGTYSANNFVKSAFAYKVNDCAVSTNATSPSIDTSVTLPVVSQTQIGTRAGSSLYANSAIKKIAYYPQRLTNAQLQSLTS